MVFGIFLHLNSALMKTLKSLFYFVDIFIPFLKM